MTATNPDDFPPEIFRAIAKVAKEEGVSPDTAFRAVDLHGGLLTVFTKAVIGRLLQFEAEFEVPGWTDRVLDSPNLDLGFDAETDELWARYVGEEFLRVARKDLESADARGHARSHLDE